MTLLLAAGALAAPLAGCESPGNGGPSSTSATPPPQASPSQRGTGPVDPEAAAAVRSYATAARAWTPGTYLAQWRRQVEGSTGSLRRTLREATPSSDEIARLRADRARVDVAIVAVTPDVIEPRVRRRARFLVSLDETTTVAGESVRRRTISRIDLVRHGELWLVTAFEPAP